MWYSLKVKLRNHMPRGKISQLEFVFLPIYPQIDGYLRSYIIHTSHLLHVTLNHIAPIILLVLSKDMFTYTLVYEKYHG